MDFKIIYPPKILQDYVRFFWFAEGDLSRHQSYTHHAFAYTCPEFSFCYKGEFRISRGSEPDKILLPGIYGQTETFGRVVTNGQFGIFGFYLFPHALTQLFGLPANELTNLAIDTKTFCGKEGEIFEERMMLARNNYQRVDLTVKFLTDRLKNIRSEHSAIISFIRSISPSQPLDSIKSLANENFLSLRQFERKFKTLTGFRPKLFFRISRFNSLLNTSFENQSLKEIAYEYGYHDHSHFTHDFKNFSGYNPKDYFSRETIAATDRGTIEF